jgi:hypothetical protein
VKKLLRRLHYQLKIRKYRTHSAYNKMGIQLSQILFISDKILKHDVPCHKKSLYVNRLYKMAKLDAETVSHEAIKALFLSLSEFGLSKDPINVKTFRLILADIHHLAADEPAGTKLNFIKKEINTYLKDHKKEIEKGDPNKVHAFDVLTEFLPKRNIKRGPSAAAAA